MWPTQYGSYKSDFTITLSPQSDFIIQPPSSQSKILRENERSGEEKVKWSSCFWSRSGVRGTGLVLGRRRRTALSVSCPCLVFVRIFRKIVFGVRLSGWTRTRQSCPDFYCPTSGFYIFETHPKNEILLFFVNIRIFRKTYKELPKFYNRISTRKIKILKIFSIYFLSKISKFRWVNFQGLKTFSIFSEWSLWSTKTESSSTVIWPDNLTG